MNFKNWVKYNLELRTIEGRLRLNLKSSKYVLNDLDDCIHVILLTSRQHAFSILERSVVGSISDLALDGSNCALWRLDEYIGAYYAAGRIELIRRVLNELNALYLPGNHVINSEQQALEIRTPRSFGLVEALGSSDSRLAQKLKEELEEWLAAIDMNDYFTYTSSIHSYLKDKVMLFAVQGGVSKKGVLKPFSWTSLHPSKFMKDITNALFAAIDIIRTDNRLDLSKIVENHIRTILNNTKSPREHFLIGKTNLCQKIALLDLLIDFTVYVDNIAFRRDLSVLIETFGPINETGLRRNEKSSIYFVDEQTDLSVAFFRYYVLYGDTKYLKKSRQLLECGWKFWNPVTGEFYKFYNSKSNFYSKDNTKYAFLFGKALLCHELKDPMQVFQNEEIIQLLKDR